MIRIKNTFYRFLSPNSLRSQLISRSFLILSALLLLVGFFQYVFMRDFLYRNTANNMKNQVRTIPMPFWEQLQAADPNQKNLHFLFFPFRNSSVSIGFVDLDGQVHDVFENFTHDQPPQLTNTNYQQAFLHDRESINYQIIKNRYGKTQLVVLEPLQIHGRPIGLAEISTPVALLQEILFRELFIYGLLSFAALVIGLFAFLPIIRKTLVPLSRIVESVEHINAGNLNERLPIHQGQIEIHRLSTSVNGMLERLETSFIAEKEAKEQMRRFIADASHELRTPLTSIHGFLEILLRGAANNQDQLKKALVSMYGESERLNKLVEDLLILAKMDRAPTFHLKKGYLDQILHEMETQLILLAGERTVQFSISEGIPVNFDPNAMKQVILNLFQNAVQHTHALDGRIEIHLKAEADGCMLTIQDNGSGIPPKSIPHLFDRFYRVDTSRARKNGGAGLGLAISKSIVEIHKGTIRVESKEGEGSQFKIWLPLCNQTT